MSLIDRSVKLGQWLNLDLSNNTEIPADCLFKVRCLSWHEWGLAKRFVFHLQAHVQQRLPYITVVDDFCHLTRLNSTLQVSLRTIIALLNVELNIF